MGKGNSIVTSTRALHRVSKRLPQSARSGFIAVLGMVLAVGVVVLSPVKAYAAVPEVRTPLAQGVDLSGPLFAS